jgi:hypothetical protein
MPSASSGPGSQTLAPEGLATEGGGVCQSWTQTTIIIIIVSAIISTDFRRVGRGSKTDLQDADTKMDSWSLVRSHRTATLLPRTQPYLRTEIKILSAKLPAASSEYPCLGSRRACTNCLAKQRKSHHKYLNNNETHRRILPQEPTAV